MYYVDSISVHIRAQQLLQIVVENQGRICYGPNTNDFKGIVSNVTIGGKIITNWKMNGIPFSDGKYLTTILEEKLKKFERSPSYYQKLELYLDQSKGSMSFWTGSFSTDCGQEARYDREIESFSNIMIY
jgi:hypothetical protein